MNASFSSPWLFIAAGAAALFFGNANPVLHLPLLALMYPACLVLLARSEYPFRYGCLCGLAGGAPAMYWISWAVHDYGAFPWPLAVPCTLIFGAWIGLWGGIFCSVLARFNRRGAPSPLWRAIMVLLLWYLIEWIRGWAATGFPWLTLGAAQARWPVLIQLASVIGDYGLSALFAAMACLACELLFPAEKGASRHENAAAAGALVLCCALVTLFGVQELKLWPERSPLDFANRTVKEKGRLPLAVTLVQGNVSQDIKWNPAFQASTLNKYMGLGALGFGEFNAAQGTEQERPDLMVWPETAMPFYYQLDDMLPARLRVFVRNSGVQLLFGAPARTLDKGTFARGDLRNRAFLLNSAGLETGYYDKIHLVPFGEYVPPFLDFPVFEPLLQGVGGFTSGTSARPLTVRNSAGEECSLGMLICYEAIFPELAREQVANGAEMLMNISNDGWYGKSSAAAQHLYHAAMRAVEQRRWLARGTNTGFTAFVDPAGRISLKDGLLPESGRGLFEDLWLNGLIWPQTEHSIYFGLHPWLPALALSLLLLVFCMHVTIQRRKC